jgi:hypothetical protein
MTNPDRVQRNVASHPELQPTPVVFDGRSFGPLWIDAGADSERDADADPIAWSPTSPPALAVLGLTVLGFASATGFLGSDWSLYALVLAVLMPSLVWACRERSGVLASPQRQVVLRVVDVARGPAEAGKPTDARGRRAPFLGPRAPLAGPVYRRPRRVSSVAG